MISDDLIKTVLELNSKLEARKNISSLNRKEIRNLIDENIGKIKIFKNMTAKELDELKGDFNICVVDGSVNRIGSNYPHYIEFFQSMALLNSNQDPVVKTRTLCPLVDDFPEEEQYNEMKKYLCITELESAIDAVQNNDVKILLMDGTLLRYEIEAHEKFQELVNLCREKNVVMVGVVEEIDTKIIMNTFSSAKDTNIGMVFDREALFNVLDMNEGFIVANNKSRKEESNIEQAFVRTSKEPCVIAIDIMKDDLDKFEDIISFVISISDENGRGIPFILDIVDKKTRIDNNAVKILIKQYLDTEIYETLFRSQRSKRII